MGVKMTSYEIARWLKEEKCFDPSYKGTYGDMIKNNKSCSRAELIYKIYYQKVPSNWDICITDRDRQLVMFWLVIVGYCVNRSKSGNLYFKMPATRELMEVIETRFNNKDEKIKKDMGKYVLDFPSESQIFCPPERNGFFNPELYRDDTIAGNVKETKEEVEEDKPETNTELEKYKTACKALVMAYSKYSKRNPEQLMRLILKKAEENYTEINSSYDFWIKINNDIDATEKVDIH